MEPELSLAERAEIERNRQKALLKLERKRRYADINDREIVSNGSVYIDSNAGFLIDKEVNNKKSSSLKQKNLMKSQSDQTERPCDLCSDAFDSSFLLDNFDCSICNKCRDPKIHNLINKTSAKEIYLLTDGDLNVRTPILRFIIKPNPKNSQWGDMKLYLEAQVAERSLDVWGSEQALENERKSRQEKIDKSKIMKYQRNMKKMRDDAKATEIKASWKIHEHCYTKESEYDPVTEVYRRVCDLCGYVDEYEEL